ncbi:MAG: hypothetical protein ACI4PF_02760 [Christensenellales bacterium]
MPKVFGKEHIIYFVISVILIIVGLICAKKFAKSEKSQKIILKSVALALLIAIITNRLSIVFKNDTHNWLHLIPDSFCGMSSLVLSLSVLLGKKDNSVLHFVWFVALIGGVITMFYPDFIGQNASVFYLPTISGLLHHTIAVALVLLVLILNYIHITYKKWYCTIFGFTCYLTLGAFLISVFHYDDAFHIMSPLLSGTPLTVWVIAPIYLTLYALTLTAFELVRKFKSKKTISENNNK